MSAAPPLADDPSPLLDALATELRHEDSVISPLVVESTAPSPLGDLVAAGPRAAPHPQVYAAVVELVREGYLLHYGTPRMIEGADSDLALLAGDYLYAKGLQRLAALGDLPAVAELAGLIADSARIHAAAAAADAAAASWLAAAVALSIDQLPDGRREAMAERDAGDAAPLLAWARAAATKAGLGDRLEAAAEAIGFRRFDRG